jgi:hypothetical protein
MKLLPAAFLLISGMLQRAATMIDWGIETAIGEPL